MLVAVKHYIRNHTIELTTVGEREHAQRNSVRTSANGWNGQPSQGYVVAESLEGHYCATLGKHAKLMIQYDVHMGYTTPYHYGTLHFLRRH
jgi:hypothetical protein